MNQKGFASLLIILGIILILGIAFGFYYFGVLGGSKTQNTISTPQKTKTTISSPIPVKKSSNIIFLRKNNLWIANTDGSNQKQLTSTNNAPWIPSLVNFKQIPNSTKIVYTSWSNIENNGSESINLLDLDTKKITVIHNFSSVPQKSYLEFDVSANGERIIYSIGSPPHSQPDNGEITVYDVKTGTEKTITNKFVLPLISPDGKKLVSIGEDNNIGVFNIDDGTNTSLTSYKSPKDPSLSDPKIYSKFEKVINVLAWSSDGKNIIYNFGNSGAGSALDTMTVHLHQVDINSKADIALTPSGIGEQDRLLGEDDSLNLYYLTTSTINLDPSGNPAPIDIGDKVSGYDQFQKGYRLQTKVSLKKSNITSKQTQVIKEFPYEFIGLEDSHWQFDSSSQKFLYSKSLNQPNSYEARIFDVKTQQDTKLMDDSLAPQWLY